jgi:hypothetical protein
VLGNAINSRTIMQNRLGSRVQLNIRNLLDSVKRRGPGTTSSGDIAVFTLPEKRTFILTNSFTF